MFEGFVTKATDAGEERVAAGPGRLRALKWSELVRRLAAARDLRPVWREADGSVPGEQDLPQASEIAADSYGKNPVNLEDLGNFKIAAGTNRSAVPGMKRARRGK